ncbi:hypothetical protein TRIUR3_09559 [Triticum urartu]|uniref:Signal recognition particle receptor subunit beta n=2 Tax=Triticum TaxID=4564 RepID=A0A9R1BL05_TRITD|nr:hypothetical protein TRIUR3_09559 [Triticum urartu]VAI72466.1 unnamed protein product [Triticum turgidum subsp. durum]
MDEWVRQAEAWAGQAEHWIRQQPPEQIYVAVAVIIVTILVLVAASCLKSSKPNTIVLSGLSGSGKTVLFYQLRDGSSHQGTVTSMTHNNATFVLHSELERFVPPDSFLFNSHDRYLYDILTKATVVKKRIPVLIFCNKTDKVTAHSKEFIKKQLEKEVNKLRESRNAISSADISDEVQLGLPGEAFNFSQCQNKVIVDEGAGLTGDVSAVEQFIREYVKP